MSTSTSAPERTVNSLREELGDVANFYNGLYNLMGNAPTEDIRCLGWVLFERDDHGAPMPEALIIGLASYFTAGEYRLDYDGACKWVERIRHAVRQASASPARSAEADAADPTAGADGERGESLGRAQMRKLIKRGTHPSVQSSVVSQIAAGRSRKEIKRELKDRFAAFLADHTTDAQEMQLVSMLLNDITAEASTPEEAALHLVYGTLPCDEDNDAVGRRREDVIRLATIADPEQLEAALAPLEARRRK